MLRLMSDDECFGALRSLFSESVSWNALIMSNRKASESQSRLFTGSLETPSALVCELTRVLMHDFFPPFLHFYPSCLYRIFKEFKEYLRIFKKHGSLNVRCLLETRQPANACDTQTIKSVL